MTAVPVPTEVRTSMIAGRGLFTTAAVAAGTDAVRLERPPTTLADLGGLNHSCDPNLGWRNDVTLATIRDVPAGDELTVDYATCTEDPDLRLYCHCETYRCRQLIEGDDWRIPQLQLRYRGLRHPALAARIESSGDSG